MECNLQTRLRGSASECSPLRHIALFEQGLDGLSLIRACSLPSSSFAVT